MRIGYAGGGKRLFETVEVVFDGLAVKVVDHPAFTTGCSTLHLLSGTAYVHTIDFFPIYDGICEDGLAGSLV